MAGFHTKERIKAEWREWFRKRRYDAEYQDKIAVEFIALCVTEEDFELAQEITEEVMETKRRCVVMAQSECPIGFVKPSWEQAQVLNAWSPEYEPSIAPDGYRSVCNFSANRSLKTSGCIFDTLLWLIPNNPDWVIFEGFEDVEGRKHGNDRGKYRVFPRPDWNQWKRSGKLIYPFLNEPPMSACEIWHGVENEDHWNDKVGKEYQKWLPKDAYGRRSDGGTALYKQERRIETRWGHSIVGKTYNSDIQAWSGKAVWRMNMDEGFDQRLFNEALLRIQGNGYFHWAYTVAEPRNIGSRAKLASDVYKGKHNLVGVAKFFTDFRLDYVPEWAMPAEKKADDVARLMREGDEGRVRLRGGFFDSSPTVFSNFERNRNVLPVEGADVRLAMRGEVPQKWIEEFGRVRADRLQFAFHDANIIRGMDEGLANPTACVWTAILRTGEYVAFREWEQSGLSVSERCQQIIDRSGNELELLNPGAPEERRRYKEKLPLNGGMKIRKTFADSKMFKRNPESPQDDWTETYRKAGLNLERATNIGPAARCDYANDMLRSDPTRQHLLNVSEPGCRAYVTRDCVKLIERLENYLWQQIAQGHRAGEFTDKPENKDDHTIDSYVYCNCSKMKWKDESAEDKGEVVHADPLTGYISL